MSGSLSATAIACAADRLLSDATIDHADGRITAVREGTGQGKGGRRLVIPGLVNAHDHARPSMTSFGSSNLPLETWIARSALGTPPDPYLAAAVSLARSARAGCAAMMVHYTRPSGTMSLPDEAAEIARAARDVGIRIAFALAVRDRNPIVYGDASELLSELPAETRSVVEEMFLRPGMSPADYVALIDAVAEAAGGPMVDIQYGPAGVQWCSNQMLEAIAEASARTGRRVHMHLLETIYQRAWADRAYPQGIVRFLKEIGLLSDRLTLAHCVHTTPEEREMIAESGATIVTNFSSNLHIHSGLGPIADCHRRGCRIAVGVDGVALDEDDDALREMRLVQMMHDGIGFERTWGRAEFLALAIANGRRSVGAPGAGTLAPGEPADMAVLDLDMLDRDAIMPVDPIDLLFARGNMGMIREVVVAGRTVARDGVVTGIDLPAMEQELRARFRANLGRYDGFLAQWQPLEHALRGWFRSHAGCC